jgi:hypothetical protein
MGEGPVAFQYSAEVFDNIHREQGMSWVVFINNFFGMFRRTSFRQALTYSWCIESHFPEDEDRHDIHWSL